jgi:hypothetical protein
MRNHFVRQTKLALVFLFVLIFITTPFVSCKTMEERMLLTEIGSIDTNGEAMNVVVRGNIAFVLDTADTNPGGLVIIDVSDPTNPVELSSLYDGGNAMELAIKDNLVFISDGTDGLETINISDLENPAEIYQYPVSTFSSDIDIVGDLLFAANWEMGFEIFNISNSLSPVKITQYNEYALNCIQFDIQDDIACITDHRNDYTGIRLLNISNPYLPELLDSYTPTNVDFWDPKIHGNNIYVGNHHEGGGELQILDITDTSSITYIEEFRDGGTIFSINFNDSLGFVADYEEGVEVINIANPSNPIEIGEYFDGGHAKNIAIKDDLIFVADLEDGLEILRTEITTIAVPGFDFQILLFSFPLIAFLYAKRKRLKR